MTCTQAGGAIVCRSPYVRTVAWCVTCKWPRPMAGTFGIWYGSSLTCLGCGDSYDSETSGSRHEVRSPRPFARGWQERRIQAARKMWRNAPTLKAEVARQMAELREEL